MLHSIPADRLGPLGRPMADAVSACVHCGFCLAACPTYRELGEETDSPRGRIVLMKEVLEGRMTFEDAAPHVDRCLGCLACEPACPSGVRYRDLISPFRTLAAPAVRRGFLERLRRWLTARTVPHPARFRLAARLGRTRLARRLAPAPFRPMLDLIPDRLPPARDWPETTPALGPRRARVALVIGCVQQVLDPDINTATIDLLARNGVEVVVPRGQGCCGALAWHTGDLAAARTHARRTLDAFPADVDAIVTNAAGCGSALHEYPLVLRGTPDADRAEAFAPRVVDAAAFLARLGTVAPSRRTPLRVAYQDACHLANAQGVRDDPRILLRAVPGVELVELPDAHLCCGSAGTYNLDQPEIATALGREKARAIIAAAPDVVASGNIGCLTQLRFHLAALGSAIPVRHTMQILRDALDD